MTDLPPLPPTSLTATPVSFGQIQLTWADISTNETGFRLERSTTGLGGSYSLLTTVPTDTISYNNVNLTAASPYCYKVRAVNGGGPSAYAGPI